MKTGQKNEMRNLFREVNFNTCLSVQTNKRLGSKNLSSQSEKGTRKNRLSVEFSSYYANIIKRRATHLLICFYFLYQEK